MRVVPRQVECGVEVDLPDRGRGDSNRHRDDPGLVVPEVVRRMPGKERRAILADGVRDVALAAGVRSVYAES